MSGTINTIYNLVGEVLTVERRSTEKSDQVVLLMACNATTKYSKIGDPTAIAKFHTLKQLGPNTEIKIDPEDWKKTFASQIQEGKIYNLAVYCTAYQGFLSTKLFAVHKELQGNYQAEAAIASPAT